MVLTSAMRGLGLSAALANGVLQAMVDVVLDQLALGVADGLLNRMELLGKVGAGAACLDHLDHGGEMTVRPSSGGRSRRDGLHGSSAHTYLEGTPQDGSC